MVYVGICLTLTALRYTWHLEVTVPFCLFFGGFFGGGSIKCIQGRGLHTHKPPPPPKGTKTTNPQNKTKTIIPHTRKAYFTYHESKVYFVYPRNPAILRLFVSCLPLSVILLYHIISSIQLRWLSRYLIAPFRYKHFFYDIL